MSYPIVHVKTRDGVLLHGLLTEPVKPAQTIDIHIHGAGGNFYGNSYFEGLTHRLVDLGMAYLSTNNRGAGIYELEKGSISHGVSLEKFADCVLDIDAWIDFALARGRMNGSSATSLACVGNCRLVPRPTFTALRTTQIMLWLCHFAKGAISPIFKIFTFRFWA